jgi:hypothetical protein
MEEDELLFEMGTEDVWLVLELVSGLESMTPRAKVAKMITASMAIIVRRLTAFLVLGTARW